MSVATPAIPATTAAPVAKIAPHCVSSRPTTAAAVPSAVRASTSPAKNASGTATPESATPERATPRPRRRAATCDSVESACVPTYPTIPMPAGRVHGHVLVEKRPPAVATSRATSGYCATESASRSMRSAGFMR